MARLRDTAEALREILASGVEYEARDYVALQAGHDELAYAQAVLAWLKQEGLA